MIGGSTDGFLRETLLPNLNAVWKGGSYAALCTAHDWRRACLGLMMTGAFGTLMNTASAAGRAVSEFQRTD